MPLPTARERRLALRLRASELVGLMEATDRDGSRGRGRPRRLRGRARDRRPVGRDHRRRGARPGARPADLPDGRARHRRRREPAPGRAAAARRFSYSSLSDVRRVPAPVRVPATSTGCRRASEPVAAFTFGSTAHAAFEAFTKERRERAARGEPPPTREDLEREFRARWTPTGVRRQGHRGGLPAAGRDPARQLLGRRGQQPRRGARTRSSTSS